MVAYDPATGGVLLGEGNHRLAAARELGLTKVPVVVYRQRNMPDTGPPAGTPAAYDDAVPDVPTMRVGPGADLDV